MTGLLKSIYTGMVNPIAAPMHSAVKNEITVSTRRRRWVSYRNLEIVVTIMPIIAATAISAAATQAIA